MFCPENVHCTWPAQIKVEKEHQMHLLHRLQIAACSASLFVCGIFGLPCVDLVIIYAFRCIRCPSGSLSTNINQMNINFISLKFCTFSFGCATVWDHFLRIRQAMLDWIVIARCEYTDEEMRDVAKNIFFCSVASNECKQMLLYHSTVENA